jgi:hypothetical protein
MKLALGLALGMLLGVMFAGGLSAYELLGFKYDHLEITYDCEIPEVGEAVREWASLSGLEDGGCSDTPDIEYEVRSPWPHPWPVIGVAEAYSSSGTVTRCVIAAADPFYGVILHEVGHCLGAGHSEDTTATMFGWCCNPISVDDRAMIVELYGPEFEVTQQPAEPTRFKAVLPMVGR